MNRAPAAERFPVWPASWYLFGASRELGKRPLSKQLLGRRLVAFRTASGKLALLDASCAHLGADLGRGRVLGEEIQCPFHNWQYGPDGNCVRIPSLAVIPAFARQTSYPVVERHGWIFFFNGREPLFPLPFFLDGRPDEFAVGQPFRFVVDCPWYLLAGHGFDVEHMKVVHDRTLLGAPRVERPTPFTLQINYTTQVTGDSLFDRLLRRGVGDRVEVSIAN